MSDETNFEGPPEKPGGTESGGGYSPSHETRPELPASVPEPSRHVSDDQSWKSARTFLLSILAILLAGAASLFIMARWESATVDRHDLLDASAEVADSIDLDFETQNSDQAARFVWDRFGRRVTTPVISDAVLVGVGTAEVIPDMRVPAYLYREADGGSITVFAYNYAILDRFEADLRLERSIFHQIVDPEHREVRDLGKERAVIWRDRDDIFLAISRDAVENVGRRILSY